MQKARYIKGLGAFGGVGDSKEEGERSRGREVAGRRGVRLLVGWADGLGWVAWAGGYWRVQGRLWAWLAGE